MFVLEELCRNPIHIGFITVDITIGAAGFGFISLDVIRRWMRMGRKKERRMDEENILWLIPIGPARAALAATRSTKTALSFIVQVQKLSPRAERDYGSTVYFKRWEWRCNSMQKRDEIEFWWIGRREEENQTSRGSGGFCARKRSFTFNPR